MIYLVRGNDFQMSVTLAKKTGDISVPYELTNATRLRLALVGHGMHVFAEDVEVSPLSSNTVTGIIPGRALLLGRYGLEITFRDGGKDKRFFVDNMFEVVEAIVDDSDDTAEGEGGGVEVSITVQPEDIDFSGQMGTAAGFGEVTAEIDANIGTPSVEVTASGPDTAKNFAFSFHNLKGPKGDQGDPGSSVDYPFTLANNLTETDSTKALAAPQGKVLDDKISQLGLKVAEHFTCEVALAGAGNTNVASADLTSFVPGHKYRAVLDWNKSAVTSGNTYDGFAIGSYDSSSTRTYLVHIMAQQVLESYYDIIIPANSVRLKVSGRANSGTTAKVRFYDLTPCLEQDEALVTKETFNGIPDDSAEGMSLETNGTAVARFTANISPLIPVHVNDAVTIRTGWTTQPSFVGNICGYDSSGVFISGQYWNVTSTANLPERTININNANVAFVRTTFFKDATEAFVKVNGVTKWTYKKPTFGTTEYNIRKTGAEKVIYGPGSLDYWIEGSYVHSQNGTRQTSSVNSTTGYINISDYERVKFAFSTIVGSSGLSSAGACFYAEDYSFISGIRPRATGVQGWETVEIDVPANAKFLCVSFYDEYRANWFLNGILKSGFAEADNPVLKALEVKPAIVGSPMLYLSGPTSDVAVSLNSKTSADIYAEYDAMVADHPTMIKRETDLGTVTYNGTDYPIRAYTIGNNTPFLIDHEPGDSEILDATDNLWTSALAPKTILVVGGMHGEEHTPCWGLMLAFKEMLDSDAQWAHYLKDNFIFKVVPCLNPSGWSTMRRADSQGNVMNRDASIDDPETTYYMNWIEANKDAFCLVDCHGSQGHYAYLPTRGIYSSSVVVNKLANYLAAAFRTNWRTFYNSIDASYGATYAPYIVAKSVNEDTTIGTCGWRMFVNYGMKSFALETPDDLVTGAIGNNDLRNCKLTKDIVINVLQSICALDVLP